MTPPKLALLVAAALAAAPAARADDTHATPYPLGGRAAQLAGAAAATADDVGALAYNPAGLADAGDGSLQLSASLYGLDFTLGQNGFADVASALVDLNRLFTELQIVPAAGGLVWGLGPRDAAGDTRHAIAAAAFVRDQRLSREDALAQVGPEAQRYAREVLDRTVGVAIGWGFRPTAALRVGASLELTYRRVTAREEASLVRDAGATFTRGETSLALSAGTLAPTLGVRWTPDPRWTLGLALTPPSIDVFGSATLQLQETRGGPDARFEVTTRAGLDARSPLPLALRGGVAFLVDDATRVALDLLFTAPRDYALVTLADADRGLAARQAFKLDVTRRATLNVAVGAEHALDARWGLSGGLWTDLSAAPAIDGARGELRAADQLPAVDRVGFSFGVSLAALPTRTWVGLSGVYGFGRDVVVTRRDVRPLGAPASFVVVDVEQLSLFVTVSSLLAL